MNLLITLRRLFKPQDLLRVLAISYYRLAGVSIGSGSAVSLLVSLRRPYNISIGDSTVIGKNCMLHCLAPDASIVIGSGSLLTQSVQIYSVGQVIIEDHVMLAGNVFVADATHCYATGDIPYSRQGFTKSSPVVIREGSWIGQNSIIMPGCSVGRCSIVGANSVVNTSIPDYSIAVGSPAKVIKTYSSALKQWVRSG
jgi:acetyltransferase-like isoleucine patch superfamily enzyme